MKSTWMVAAVVAAGSVATMSVNAEECRPGVRMLTVYAVNDGGAVSKGVLSRARNTATRLLAGAGVTVEWVDGERPNDPERSFCGERLTVAFNAKAPERFQGQAMAYANVSAGSGTAIHMFMNRIANFEDRSHMPEFLGGLLAHEIAHMLQGVARHSSAGVMKAPWTGRDLESLVSGRLPFAPEDVKLIQARFGDRMLVAANTH